MMRVKRNLFPNASRRRREARPRSLRRQRDVLCDVMLAAGQCETWLTLHEVAQMTGFGEASVSAQLRHLRKTEYGGFVVEKRQRSSASAVNAGAGPLWEYQLRRGLRTVEIRDGTVSNSGGMDATTYATTHVKTSATTGATPEAISV